MATIYYELWDGETGNLVNTYDAEVDALAVIREAIRRHGRSYIDTLAVLRVNARGRAKVIAEGPALADRALAAAPAEVAGRATNETPVPT